MKRNLKRNLLSVVAVVIVAIVVGTLSLVGCKEEAVTETTEAETTEAETTEAETTEEAGEKITLTMLYSAGQPSEDLYTSFAKDYMAENPNVIIKNTFILDSEIPTKLKTTISGGGGFDIIRMFNLEAAWFKENNTLAEVIPSAIGVNTMQEVLDMWEPNSFKITGAEYKGKYYGIPEQIANYVGWINIKYMKEAGLDPVKDIPKTWDEMVEVAKKMVVKENGVITRDGFSVGLAENLYPFIIMSTLAEQKGLDWSTEEGLLASLDKPEAVEALKEFTDWALIDGIWEPGLMADATEQFGAGVTGMMLQAGSWYFSALPDFKVTKEEIMPIKYPRFADGKDIGGFSYGYSYIVPETSKYIEEAWKYIKYISDRPDDILKIANSYTPRKTIDKDLVTEVIPYADLFMGDELAKGAILVESAHFGEIQDATALAVDDVLSKGTSPENAIAELKISVQNILN